MIVGLPSYISIVFGLTAFITLFLFYWTIKHSSLETVRNKASILLFGLTLWLVLQAVLSLKNVYNTNTSSLPPKIMLLGVTPMILTIILLFATARGRRFIDSLPLVNITYLHIVRIPVELVLFWLFLNKAVPQLMTFEGRNFDIFAGITAPFIAYLGLIKKKLSPYLIMAWNIICLALLANIVISAALSAPSPLQKIGFDQPNIAMLNFPFSWLPSFIVPIVLFGHLVAIRQLSRKR